MYDERYLPMGYSIQKIQQEDRRGRLYWLMKQTAPGWSEGKHMGVREDDAKAVHDCVAKAREMEGLAPIYDKIVI